jgi:hypothetical protein
VSAKEMKPELNTLTRPTSLEMLRTGFITIYLVLRYVVVRGVAVEKLAFFEESRNLGDRKCLGELWKNRL